MKKKLLAASIAAAIAVPTLANAGEHRFYGDLRGSVSSVDESFDDGREGESFDNNDSQINFQGDHGPGIYHVQVGIRNDENDGREGSGSTYLRQVYAGIKGSYGTVTVGRRSTDYKWYGGEEVDPFFDTSAVGARGRFATAGPTYGLSQLTDDFTDGSIAYLSPVYKGFQANGGIYIDDSDVDEHTYGAGLRYKTSGVVVGVQYLDFGSVDGDDLANDDNGNGVVDEGDFIDRPVPGSEGFEDALRAHGGFQGRNFFVGVSYEKLGGESGFRDDRDYLYVHGKYQITPATALAASYGQVDDDAETDNTDPAEGLISVEGDGYNVGVFHKLFEKTTIYGLYSDVSLDNGLDTEVFSLGLNQGFEFGE